ncbi:hypothetical protein NDU88_001549 [Pleurodeles waltl]|uniref:Uncharacterized protein n=1 Tax=Pleurodeles waltl TaxID=8319 RepID=A0AAV7LA36_PLEWA|nr:hypothetical protein NDU88_001549 [Pleurodeles waltl]
MVISPLINGGRKSEGRHTRKEGVSTSEGKRNTKLRHRGRLTKDKTDRHRTTREAPAPCRRFLGNRMRVGRVSREVTVPSCHPTTLPEYHG